MTQAKRYILLPALLLLISLPATAQLLWRVTGNGAKGASFLFGTHHAAPALMADSTPGLREAIAAADMLYAEIDMEEMNSDETLRGMSAAILSPPDSTLSDLLKPEQLDSLDRLLRGYTDGVIRASQLEVLKPGMVASQLSMMQIVAACPGFAAGDMPDRRVQVMAREAGIPVRAFETPAGQLEMLLADPIAVQAEALMECVAHDSELRDMARELADAYICADLDRIEELMLRSPLAPDAEEAERLIYARNRRWLSQLEKALPEKSVFIAVGAGHLVGDNGLISMLRAMGYTVEPAEKAAAGLPPAAR